MILVLGFLCGVACSFFFFAALIVCVLTWADARLRKLGRYQQFQQQPNVKVVHHEP